jgi:hypothetical protein
MGKLCMIMHLITLCTSCIAFMFVAHTCIIVIGHEEQGHEESPEPAPVEAGNHEQDQGKPVHLTTILEFILFFLYLNYNPWMCIKL